MAKKTIVKHTNVILVEAGRKGVLGGRGERTRKKLANIEYRTFCRFFFLNYLTAVGLQEKRAITTLIYLVLELVGFYFVDFVPVDESIDGQGSEDEKHDTASDGDDEVRDQQRQRKGSFRVVTKKEAKRRIGQYLRDGRTKSRDKSPHVGHPPLYEMLQVIGRAVPRLVDECATELANEKYQEYVKNHPNLQQHRASTPALAEGDDSKPTVSVTPKSKTAAPEPFQFLARRPSPPPATKVTHPLPAIVAPRLAPFSSSSTSSVTLARRAPTPEEIENLHVNMEMFEAVQRVSLFEALEDSTAARQWTFALPPRASRVTVDDMNLDSLACPRNNDPSNIEPINSRYDEPMNSRYDEPIKLAGADNQFAMDDDMEPLTMDAWSDAMCGDQSSTKEVTNTGSCKNLDPIAEKINLGEDFGGHHFYEVIVFPQEPNVISYIDALDAMDLSRDIFASK